MTLALCLVGCGNYARTIAKQISTLGQQVELFFASRDRNKAQEYCQTYGGSDFFGSYDEAAKDKRVEALYILTPHNLHCEHALMAARHGKHILVEKPIARNLVEAQVMVRAAKDAGVKLMVGENARFIPMVQKCKELFESGAIGPLRLIQIQAEQVHSPHDWRRSLEISGGGALIDGGIHSVDNMIYLAGMPSSLFATTLPKVLHQVEGEDGIVVMAQLPDGATGLINFSWGTQFSPRRPWVALTGAKGHISFEIGGPRLVLEQEGQKTEHRFPKGDYGWKNMVIEFVDAIQQDRCPTLSGEEGIKALKVVLKAYESAQIGMSVGLE